MIKALPRSGGAYSCGASEARAQRSTERTQGREAAKGYDYRHSNLQDRDLHRTQHKYDDFGRANAERPPQ